MTVSEILKPFIEQGLLGALCGVLLIIIMRLFQKVVSVVEKNTEGFHKNAAALDSLEKSIRDQKGK